MGESLEVKNKRAPIYTDESQRAEISAWDDFIQTIRPIVTLETDGDTEYISFILSGFNGSYPAAINTRSDGKHDCAFVSGNVKKLYRSMAEYGDGSDFDTDAIVVPLETLKKKSNYGEYSFITTRPRNIAANHDHIVLAYTHDDKEVLYSLQYDISSGSFVRTEAIHEMKDYYIQEVYLSFYSKSGALTSKSLVGYFDETYNFINKCVIPENTLEIVAEIGYSYNNSIHHYNITIFH